MQYSMAFFFDMDNPAVQLEYDSSPDEYLEPNVQRHAGVIPKSVCKELIDLGEEGTAFLLLFKNLVTCLFLLLRVILYFLLCSWFPCSGGKYRQAGAK